MSDVPKKYPTRSVPVVQEMPDEVSQAIAIQTQIAASKESTWRTLGQGLALVIAAGTIAWAAGGAFFVPKTEYNARIQQEIVNTESFRQTLAQLDRSIAKLTIVSDKMNESVQELKTGLAVISATHKK